LGAELVKKTPGSFPPAPRPELAEYGRRGDVSDRLEEGEINERKRGGGVLRLSFRRSKRTRVDVVRGLGMKKHLPSDGLRLRFFEKGKSFTGKKRQEVVHSGTEDISRGGGIFLLLNQPRLSLAFSQSGGGAFAILHC